MELQNMHVVILAGGKGTRLFPLSRELFSKQFIRLIDGKSLLELTIERIPEECRISIVTNAETLFIVKEMMARYPGRQIRILAEPEGKNTAPAIVYACSFMSPGETVLVVPSDHYITGREAFLKELGIAARAASEGNIVLFGVRPQWPETGYGYIEAIASDGFVWDVKRFVEKPTLDMARKYCSSGNFFWNSGMFVFTRETFFSAVEKDAPTLSEVSKRLLSVVAAKGKQDDLAAVYGDFPSISIDYAIMEKADNIRLIPVTFGWSDIGSFDAYKKLLRDLGKPLVSSSDQFFLPEMQPELFGDTAGNLVIGKTGKEYCVLGYDNVILIDTDDALLLCRDGESQRTKEFFNAVADRDSNKSCFHNTVKRPWGMYTALYAGESGYKVKRIEVKTGEMLSLQYHRQRSEHWIVVAGQGMVTVGDSERSVSAGDHVFVGRGEKHRIGCTSAISLVLIEVQLGDYLGEDDIVRIEDKYGR